MASRKQKPDERVDKRRVTMTNFRVVREPDGGIKTLEETATDWVRPDVLDAYVADAGRRWADVQVSEEPDAGPAGYDGPTFVPFGVMHNITDSEGRVIRQEWHEFPHELAGTFYPATGCTDCEHAPEHPLTGGRARTIRVEG